MENRVFWFLHYVNEEIIKPCPSEQPESSTGVQRKRLVTTLYGCMVKGIMRPIAYQLLWNTVIGLKFS